MTIPHTRKKPSDESEGFHLLRLRRLELSKFIIILKERHL
jgi:hypothetical protein